MGMSMRPYQMGLGYGMGSMGNEPGYFGSADPGRELADVMLRQRADERASAAEKSRAALEGGRLDLDRARLAHEQAMDPLNEALLRARLVGMGVRLPGMGGGGGEGGDAQAGLPSAGIMAGSRSNPLEGVQGGQGGDRRNAAGPLPDVGNRTQGMPSGLMGPTGTSPGGGGAHLMPGAFNPETGTHNPAMVDIGGGFSMADPSAQRAGSARDLLASGLLPNLTPAGAAYLSQHPEHIAALMQAERDRRGAGGETPDERIRVHNEERLFDVAHPTTDKPELSVAGGMQDIDRQMPGRLTQAGRFGLAQRMSKKGFDPSKEPAMGTIDELAAALPDNHDPEKAKAVFAKYGFSPATTDSILQRAAARKTGGQPAKKTGGLFGRGGVLGTGLFASSP